MLDIDNRGLNWLLVFNFHLTLFFIWLCLCSGDWWAEQSDRNKSIFFLHLYDPLSQVLDYNIYFLMILIGTGDLLRTRIIGQLWGLASLTSEFNFKFYVRKRILKIILIKICGFLAPYTRFFRLRWKIIKGREEKLKKSLRHHTSFIIRSTSSLTIAFIVHTSVLSCFCSLSFIKAINYH